MENCRVAVERLKGVGEWMSKHGETIYGTTAGNVMSASWGTTTRKDNMFLCTSVSRSYASVRSLAGDGKKLFLLLCSVPVKSKMGEKFKVASYCIQKI